MSTAPEREIEVIFEASPEPEIIEAAAQPTALSRGTGFIAPMTQAEMMRAEIRSIEDDILKKSSDIVDATLAFAEVDPSHKEPPEAWIRKLGYEKALQRFRVARSSWMSSKEGPVALRIAKEVFGSIVKARSVENSGQRTLNVAFVEMSVPLPRFEKKKVDR